jgi:hypothetical protein
MWQGATDWLDTSDADTRLALARCPPGRYNRATEFGVGPTPAMLRCQLGLDLMDAVFFAIYGIPVVNGGSR